MSLLRNTLIAAAVLLCQSSAFALATPLARVLPNRITPTYMIMDALHRTYRQEKSGNGQRAAINARYGVRPAARHRTRLATPVAISESMTTYLSAHGLVAAYKVVVIGSTRVRGVAITSLFTYTYAAKTGLLLQYSSALASPALARAHDFPVNTF